MAEELVPLHDAGVLDDEELLIFDNANRRNNLHGMLPYRKYDRFVLEDMDESQCLVEFRFKKGDIYNRAHSLRLPEVFRCGNGLVVDSVEALCICMKRLAYPCRYADLIPRFGRPVPHICMIHNKVIDFIVDTHGELLRSLDQPFLSSRNLLRFANALHHKGAALDNCWGFIDGTVRPICRPKHNQRVVYNGHKRVHAINFQSVVTPSGIIANVFGPVEGRRHDSGMLAMSGLLEELETYSFSPTGQPLCIYGDPAYPHRVHLQCPFARRAVLSPVEQAFNESMSQVRVSVEWVFGDIVNYFKVTDFKKDLKIGLSAVGKFYIVSALLHNAMTCLYGNNTSTYFGVQPPTLDEYFTRE